MPVSNLISVNYTDLTGHQSVTSGDIMGVPFEYHWGPVDVLQVLTEGEFFDAYPESLPTAVAAGWSSTDTGRYFAYAQIKKAFEAGITTVEVVRPQGAWKYVESVVTSSVSTTQVANLSSTEGLHIATKFPGLPPKSLYQNYGDLAFKVSGYDASKHTFKLQVAGYTTSDRIPTDSACVVLEEYDCSLEEQAVVDGKSMYVGNVVKSSDFIQAFFVKGTSFPSALSNSWVCITVDNTNHNDHAYPSTTLSATDYKNAINTYYSDELLSDSTMLISPMFNEGSSQVVSVAISNIAEERQTLNAVLAVDGSEDDVFDDDAIASSLALFHGRFTFLVAGREIIEVFGHKMESNCCAGFCGCTAKVARQERVNQLASAFTFGKYPGSLTTTASIDKANKLMKNKGVISVISTKYGNLIWGTRTTYDLQSSYWADANVSRVVAFLLRNSFPIALDVIHTAAASDELERARVSSRFESVLNDLIATRNLNPTLTKVDLGGNINSAAATKGGRVLNVCYTLQFYGLVEEVKFNIVATDDSVTTTIA